MSDGRRLRLREQGTTKGPVRTQRKVRNRLGSVSCSNEESTEGEDDTVGCAKKISGGVNRNRVAERPKDTDRGLRTGIKKNNRSNGIRVPLAEEDVIDGFLILSFMTYQDLEITLSTKQLFLEVLLSSLTVFVCEHDNFTAGHSHLFQNGIFGTREGKSNRQGRKPMKFGTIDSKRWNSKSKTLRADSNLRPRCEASGTSRICLDCDLATRLENRKSAEWGEV
ncbi:hypothetical protein AVEN_72138-1 [Araneus ventricosus]|uniref:Uncharacterized protein n=1 Tax=Araneus ventricosus TaxID=182803 RepID=A0A4Y2JIB0_ARAVE|nr:hypothetical protein AVEN_72138-1 [Araneus ventricosus]